MAKQEFGEIGARLYALQEGDGIRSPNLPKILGPQLCSHWGVDPGGPKEEAFRIVRDQLELLLEAALLKLPLFNTTKRAEQARFLVRVRFKILDGLPNKRIAWLDHSDRDDNEEEFRISERNQRIWLNDLIIPEMEKIIIAELPASADSVNTPVPERSVAPEVASLGSEQDSDTRSQTSGYSISEETASLSGETSLTAGEHASNQTDVDPETPSAEHPQNLASPVEPAPDNNGHTTWLRRRLMIAIFTTAAVLVTVIALISDGDDTTAADRPTVGTQESHPTPTTSPRPADPSSPPVNVLDPQPLMDNEAGTVFALHDVLQMDPSELANFNEQIYAQSAEFDAWYATHDGIPVGSGYTTFTLEGNMRETVGVTDMRVKKECGPPLDTTLFQINPQGTSDNIGIAFDLTEPNPMPQEMELSPPFRPLGTNYFYSHTIKLDKGERETLTVLVNPGHYHCTFRFQITVTTSEGPFTQIIDHNGDPYAVTGRAEPTVEGAPYSGYQAAYIIPPGIYDWLRVDPATYPQS